MEKEEITIELLYRKLENRLTEEEVKHFEMWMQDIDHQRYYQNLRSFYELREAGRPDSAEVNRAWIDLQSRINKQGLKPGRNRLLWRGSSFNNYFVGSNTFNCAARCKKRFFGSGDTDPSRPTECYSGTG